MGCDYICFTFRQFIVCVDEIHFNVKHQASAQCKCVKAYRKSGCCDNAALYLRFNHRTHVISVPQTHTHTYTCAWLVFASNSQQIVWRTKTNITHAQRSRKKTELVFHSIPSELCWNNWNFVNIGFFSLSFVC